ncbi:hypothetical protein T09_9382 [Trichinella sp. T9]|nr:hypothetical protein T09_9382 [Trichinella sp. T9]
MCAVWTGRPGSLRGRRSRDQYPRKRFHSDIVSLHALMDRRVEMVRRRGARRPAKYARGAYEDELRKWIKDGCLVPYDESEHGPPKGLLLLMAVIQRNKKKVRPVMDFRELNAHIESHTADADVCSQKLREWRRQGVNVALIDLKKTYLQIRIDKSLWPYQTVVFKGKRYCLTHLGFGLNVAPLVMKAVMNCVLSRDPDVRKGTSAYIDDIRVNESVVAVDRVKRHLAH